jgi:hypothetical protein
VSKHSSSADSVVPLPFFALTGQFVKSCGSIGGCGRVQARITKTGVRRPGSAKCDWENTKPGGNWDCDWICGLDCDGKVDRVAAVQDRTMGSRYVREHGGPVGGDCRARGICAVITRITCRAGRGVAARISSGVIQGRRDHPSDLRDEVHTPEAVVRQNPFETLEIL